MTAHEPAERTAEGGFNRLAGRTGAKRRGKILKRPGDLAIIGRGCLFDQLRSDPQRHSYILGGGNALLKVTSPGDKMIDPRHHGKFMPTHGMYLKFAGPPIIHSISKIDGTPLF